MNDSELFSFWAITLIVVVAIVIFLNHFRLWWLIFAIAGLASTFALIASVIHFQILGALGFTFLAGVCWWLTDKTSY